MQVLPNRISLLFYCVLLAWLSFLVIFYLPYNEIPDLIENFRRLSLSVGLQSGVLKGIETCLWGNGMGSSNCSYTITLLYINRLIYAILFFFTTFLLLFILSLTIIPSGYSLRTVEVRSVLLSLLIPANAVIYNSCMEELFYLIFCPLVFLIKKNNIFFSILIFCLFYVVDTGNSMTFLFFVVYFWIFVLISDFRLRISFALFSFFGLFLLQDLVHYIGLSGDNLTDYIERINVEYGMPFRYGFAVFGGFHLPSGKPNPFVIVNVVMSIGAVVLGILMAIKADQLRFYRYVDNPEFLAAVSAIFAVVSFSPVHTTWKYFAVLAPVLAFPLVAALGMRKALTLSGILVFTFSMSVLLRS